MERTNRCLKALMDKKEAITTINLAKEIGAAQASVRAQCNALKDKGYIDGDSTGGWWITEAGREAVERGEEIPVSAKDAGTDIASKFKYYGRLHGVPDDLILATLDIAQSRDLENLEAVWDAMTEMGVELTARRRWIASWRVYLKQGMPPTLKEKVEGTTEAQTTGKGDETPPSAKKEGRDYIIVDDLPVRVGSDQGDFTLQDAKDLVTVRAIRSRAAGSSSGGGGQQWGIQDIISLVDKVREKGGNGGGPKTYVVQYTEQGAVLKEAAPGEPIVLTPQPGSKTAKTVVVHPDGTTEQVEPGHPIVIKQAANPPPTQKTIVVRQTEKGLVTEEYESGKPIILESKQSGGGTTMGLPFPVFGSDGKPVLDSEGRPVYANLEPTLKWLGFVAEQKRADERHGALMKLVDTVKDNLGDGIAALKAAAEEAKRSGTGKEAAPPQPQVYECGQCHTRFTIPSTEFESIGCPNCKHIYTKKEILG